MYGITTVAPFDVQLPGTIDVGVPRVVAPWVTVAVKLGNVIGSITTPVDGVASLCPNSTLAVVVFPRETGATAAKVNVEQLGLMVSEAVPPEIVA
jgi:hypothetical protein